MISAELDSDLRRALRGYVERKAAAQTLSAEIAVLSVELADKSDRCSEEELAAERAWEGVNELIEDIVNPEDVEEVKKIVMEETSPLIAEMMLQ